MNGTLISDLPESFVAHDAPVQTVRFSPSGRMLATADTNVQIKIWRDGEVLFTIDPASHQDKVRPLERVRAIEFSPDEKYVYVTASDTLLAFDVASGKLAWDYTPPRFLGFLIAVPQAVAVSSTGLVATAFDYGSIATFTPDGQQLYYRHDNWAPRMMGFSPHGKALVGSDRFNLCVWDAETGSLAHRWRLDHKVFAMAVSHSEPLVATRELRTMTLWDIDTLKKLCELPAGIGLPLLAFSPTERVLATGEKTRIRLVNLECKKVRDLGAEDSTVLALTFSPDGRQVVGGCSDHRVRFWRLD